MITLKEPVEFEWDRGNQDKNWLKHKVTIKEAEEAFFDEHKLLSKDTNHSTKQESRYLLIGETVEKRKLFLVFTIRKQKIRIISVRDLNKREYKLLKK